MKWKSSDYEYPFQHWTPPKLVYPCSASEKDALHAIKETFAPLPPYKQMEAEAIKQNALVPLEIPLPDGHIAFLENTAEKCTSPDTKHSRAGMQGARHWVQRVDTPENVFRRFTDGFGNSLMFGERCHQYIRNSNTWRGVSGTLLDIDDWRKTAAPGSDAERIEHLLERYGSPADIKVKISDQTFKSELYAEIKGEIDVDTAFISRTINNFVKPPPCYSQQELFERYPLLPRICRFILPTATSLFEGRPYNARGVVLFPEPITDQRVYRAFGDILCGELDCIPPNVTKNPVAVGFGNTHNAPDAFRSDTVETGWIADGLEQATANVLTETQKRTRAKKKKAEKDAHYSQQRTSTGGKKGASTGENISAFIDECDPVEKMIEEGWLTPRRGNEYHWHESGTGRGCTIQGHGIRIYSASMAAASPAADGKPVDVHRFYLYYLSGLDMTKDSDKPKCREYLFALGYGTDPKEFAEKQHKKGRRKQVKLFKSEFEGLLETLERAREFLKEVFEKGVRFFAVRTDTGTGKTEKSMTYALTKDVVLPTQSHTLSSEVVGRATKKGIYAWDYRGIGYHPPEAEAVVIDGRTYDAEGYMSCIQSERFEALRKNGFNPYKWICDGCPAYLECKAEGYLSQPTRARQAQLVALPFPTAFLDPRLRNWAKLYLPRGTDALILHDDLPIGTLFYECRLSAKRLRQIYEDWKGTKAAEWAEACLTAFGLRDFEMLQKIISCLTDAEYSVVTEALTHCIDPLSGAIITPDEYLSHPSVNFSTEDACTQLPQVEADGADIATLLGAFFIRYPRVADAPFYFETSTESFVFYLPPKPYFAKKSLRIGFASATLVERLIRRIFPDIEFYDAAATEWVEGARVYQLRTNRNPRATVLNFVEKYTATGEKVWVWDGLNATGEVYYQRVLDFIKAHPNDRHAVLSYKAVIEEKRAELDALGVVSGWFGNLAGLDETFEGVKYFHILFCPYTDPEGVDLLVKQLFGNDETPIKRDATGTLQRTEDGDYEDERAQVCHDALVDGELRQVVGRARLNLYPNMVFLWTSRGVDGISNRTETVLFDEVDWHRAGNDPAKLQAIVTARETAEQNGDAQAYAEATGESKRTARRRTEPTRKQRKAERDAEIFRRYDAGETQEDIAVAMGLKSKSTVSRVLKKRKF